VLVVYISCVTQVISRTLYIAMTDYKQDAIFNSSPSLAVSSDTAKLGGLTTSESSGLSRSSRTLKAVPAGRLAEQSSDPFSPDSRTPESSSSSDDRRIGYGKGKGTSVRKRGDFDVVPAGGDNVSAGRTTKQDHIGEGNAFADESPRRQMHTYASKGSVVLPFTDPEPQPPKSPMEAHIGDEDDEGEPLGSMTTMTKSGNPQNSRRTSPS